MKDQTQVVIIGGGIFGASVAYHLTEFGCNDIMLLDKGELTNGTSFHSVGRVSQFRTSPAIRGRRGGQTDCRVDTQGGAGNWHA